MDKFIFINPYSGKQIKENGPVYTLLLDSGNIPLKMSEQKFINSKLKNAQKNLDKTMEIFEEKEHKSKKKRSNSVEDILKNLEKATEIMKKKGILPQEFDATKSNRSNNCDKTKKYKNKIEKLFDSCGFKTVKCKKNGECFFQSVSIALNKPITELREIVSKNITYQQFSFWKEIWEATENEEFDFMEGINTIDELREVILTTDFWGEEVSINILQNHFNLGMIIIDSVTNNVVKNFKFSDTNKYIILNFTGIHYDLVKYNNIALFNKITLPVCVLNKISEMEKN